MVAHRGYKEKIMNPTIRIAAVLTGALLFVAVTALGQDDGVQGYTYSTYYVCDVATQSDMDDVVEKFEKPVLDKAVEDGHMTGWGYFSHMTGGKWRRLQFHSAPTIAELIHNQETIFAEIYGDNPAGGQVRGNACAGHDDYIWAQINGGGGGEATPGSSLSVYYECDFMREAETDEIVSETYAPVLNEMVEDGKLIGWGWLAHRVGGKYRRLQTFLGASHAEVLAARAEFIQMTGGPGAGGFGEICGSHTDYLWTVHN